MLMELSLGAEVDIASGDELKHGLKDIKNKIRHQPKPLYLDFAKSAVSDGTNLRSLNLGSPPVGRIWEISSIAIVGSDDHTPIANVFCALYCGDPHNLSLGMLQIPAVLAIPSFTSVSDETLYCHDTANVVVQAGQLLASGQQLAAVVHVKEWRMSEILMDTGAGG